MTQIDSGEAPWDLSLWGYWCDPWQMLKPNKTKLHKSQDLLTSRHDPSSASVQIFLHLIFYLHWSLLPILIFPNVVRLYITYNRRKLVCLLDHMNPFGRVNNIAVTWNRSINYVQPFLRQNIQSPITNSILHYVTWNIVQRGWIDQMVLIITDLNINIGAEGSSIITSLFLCPKITHMLGEVLLCLIIILKALFE